MAMGPYAGVDYNLTLVPLQSRLQHIYHGRPHARVDPNPMPESTLSPSHGLWIWPLNSISACRSTLLYGRDDDEDCKSHFQVF